MYLERAHPAFLTTLVVLVCCLSVCLLNVKIFYLSAVGSTHMNIAVGMVQTRNETKERMSEPSENSKKNAGSVINSQIVD